MMLTSIEKSCSCKREIWPILFVGGISTGAIGRVGARPGTARRPGPLIVLSHGPTGDWSPRRRHARPMPEARGGTGGGGRRISVDGGGGVP
jgi:hypothetical protein